MRTSIEILTVGHSNHEARILHSLLEQHGIQTLVDIRSQPYSQYSPQFNREALQASLASEGIGYEFQGGSLGGRPRGPFYDPEGHVLYGRLAQAPGFLEGIDWLIRLASRERTVIMCSEEDPADCHRTLLVGRVLAERGVQVKNIRGDGRLEEWFPQAGLFGDEEDPNWRSVRSVSPGPRQRPSSEG